jgi:LysR family transcriptional regulator, hydrogen peroxide-inducible genes activator
LFKSIVSYGAIVEPYHAAMNLRDLEYVVAVADHQHFGRAAAACNVSQPTLSGQILKLEAELGLRLFEREGRGARVSDRAAAVVAQARATLAAAAGVADAARAARDPFAGPLRLGVIATVAPYLLPIALPGAVAALPLTPLHLVEDLTDRLIARLREGALDGAVIATEPEADRFAAIPLYEEPFILVLARGRARKRASIRVEDIDPGALLLLADGHCLRDQALALCGVARKAALGADVRATSLETLRHLVSAGQGTTLAPLLAYADWRRLGAELDGLKIVGGGASRTVRLVFRPGSPRRVALEALAASLRRSAKSALAASRPDWSPGAA